MILSAVHRCALGRKVIRELGRPEMNAFLSSCLAAVKAGMAPAGLEMVCEKAIADAEFEYGTRGAVVRLAHAFVYEAGEEDETRGIRVTLRLVTDLGEPGDTAMTMALQLEARRETGAPFLLGRRVCVRLEEYYVVRTLSTELVSAALVRLRDRSGPDCAKVAQEFCQQLVAELAP